MADVVEQFIAPLVRAGASARGRLPVAWQSLSGLESARFISLIQGLIDHRQSLSQCLSEEDWQLVMGALIEQCDRRSQDAATGEIAAKIADFYRDASGLAIPRYQLLICLSALGTGDAAKRFVELMCDDPPTDPRQAAAPFLPLMRPSAVLLQDAWFPALYQCLGHPQLAPLVMDVANYFARQQPGRAHSGADRSQQLIRLLEGVTQQLERVQAGEQSRTGEAPEGEESVASKQVDSEAMSSAIALAISLCDTLALIGDSRARGSLSHAMRLRHRRLQLEAASALARLGDEEGKQALLALASEPSLRLRVIEYARELGMEEQIPEAFMTGAALAEAGLVTYLSLPQQFGVPPSRCELVEATTLYWPGYEEPRECYLFRFTYEAIDPRGEVNSFSNLGFAGPVTYADADIDHLPPADAIALVAGWDADHVQIRERSLRPPAVGDAVDQQLLAALAEGPYEAIEPCLSGTFFDQRVVVAKALRGDCPGLALSTADGVEWFPTVRQPLQPADLFSIYKGRRLLAMINDGYPAS